MIRMPKLIGLAASDVVHTIPIHIIFLWYFVIWIHEVFLCHYKLNGTTAYNMYLYVPELVGNGM